VRGRAEIEGDLALLGALFADLRTRACQPMPIEGEQARTRLCWDVPDLLAETYRLQEERDDALAKIQRIEALCYEAEGLPIDDILIAPEDVRAILAGPEDRNEP